ncbi:zf-HC2 domain-containing protein [Flexivirga sp. B27]
MTLFAREPFARAEPDVLRGGQNHLGDRVADYVDGMLSADEQYRADIHLTVCEHCRYAVQQERAIIEQLRAVTFDSGGHQQLMAGLLSLASTDTSSDTGAPLGAAPVGRGTSAGTARPAPALVTCTAPPQYQSARKSMACALFAVAGCVGVALVASTATGVAQGPKNPQQEPVDRAALVRNMHSPQITEAAQRRAKVSGTLTQQVPTFQQAAALPDR